MYIAYRYTKGLVQWNDATFIILCPLFPLEDISASLPFFWPLSVRLSYWILTVYF